MIRDFRNRITTDPNGYTYYDWVNENGVVLIPNARPVPKNVTQEGDKWRSQAANLVAKLDDATGVAYLDIDEGQTGADRGPVRHFRANGKPDTLEAGRICALPDGVAYIGNGAGLPSLLTAEINTGAPGAGNDWTGGYKPGDEWTLPEAQFINMVPPSVLTRSNWPADASGTGYTFSLSITGETITAQYSRTSGTSATVDAKFAPSLGNLAYGHVYCLFMTAGRATTDGGSIYVYSGSSTVFATARGTNFVCALFTPEAAVNSIGIGITNTNTTFRGATVTGSGLGLVDLTASQGAGSEFTKEQAEAFFSAFAGYQAAYTRAGATYKCLSAAENAAIWKKIALEG